METIKDYDRLIIDFKIAPCVNNCIFCHAGDEYKRVATVPFQAVKPIIEKLMEWKEKNTPTGFKMFINSSSWDHKNLVEDIQLNKMVHTSSKAGTFMLGGLKHRPEPEMRELLTVIKEAGVEYVGMTYWGPREMHDVWCGGRKGEYDFNMMVARLAPEIGMKRREHLFLLKSSLPHLASIMDILDAIPGTNDRYVLPLNYLGRGVNLEHERLTQEEYTALPDRIRKYIRTRDLRTEKQWMDFVEHEWDERQIAKVLRTRITRDNIEKYEVASADEIMAELLENHDRVYAALPDFRNMSRRYGDPTNDKIYSLGDLENKWSLQYYRDHPAVVLELKRIPLLTLRPVPND